MFETQIGKPVGATGPGSLTPERATRAAWPTLTRPIRLVTVPTRLASHKPSAAPTEAAAPRVTIEDVRRRWTHEVAREVAKPTDATGHEAGALPRPPVDEVLPPIGVVEGPKGDGVLATRRPLLRPPFISAVPRPLVGGRVGLT